MLFFVVAEQTDFFIIFFFLHVCAQDETADVTGPSTITDTHKHVSPLLFLNASVYFFCSPAVDLIFSGFRLERRDASLSFTALACINNQAPGRWWRALWRTMSHHTVSFLPADVTTNRRQPPDVLFFHRPCLPSPPPTVHTQWLIALPSSLPQHLYPHPLLLFSFF